MKKAALTLTLFFILQALTFAQVPNDDRVLLQGFFWESHEATTEGWYNSINAQASEIGNAGFDMIWMPPPSDAGSLEGYLPRELNNMSNHYGDASEHAAMIDALHAQGIEVIADIVINHRVGCTNWMDFCNPAWGSASITGDDEVWSQAAYNNVYPRGNWDTGTAYGPARDIDHTNSTVQQGVIDWMNNVLKDIGYDGWRYDFVHGFSPSYISLYNNNSNPSFSVGEYWTQDKQAIQNWIDASGSTAFDFPTYYALKGAIRDGNWSYLAFNGAAAGGIGWDPRNYTTFIENHDTPDYDPANNVLNGNNVGSAYAYLLTHPGVPTVFYSHYFNWGAAVKQEIGQLIAARKEAAVHSQSALTIHASQAGVYGATIEGNNHKLAVKLGYGNWDPTSAGVAGNWILVTSGNNYAVWKDEYVAPELYDITVYVQGLSTAYAWDDNQNPLLGGWPGTNMTSDNAWNTITFQSTTPCANIIFSNNGANQTDDLYSCGGYYYDGTFHDNPPSGGGNNGGGNNGSTVYVQGYSSAYAWDNNQNPLLGGWPGTALTDEGNGWFSITLPTDCANIIFSNNGANQTADLYTCGGYYYFGNWYCDNPLSQSSMTVYVQGYSSVYAWDDNQNPLLGGWPGIGLTNESNGWYSANIPANCANVIFSNNGSNQTADLYSCGGYYQNGNWTCSTPNGNSSMTAALDMTESINRHHSSIFPTIINHSHFNLVIDAAIDTTSDLQIFNLAGQQIYSKAIDIQTGFNKFQITIPNKTQAGVYIVHYVVGSTMHSHKIIVQ